jgi:signal peptidase II|tara:strand:- start:64 stop:564 length:501 start_codon:yes stop_codon:yes gene_type:complete
MKLEKNKKLINSSIIIIIIFFLDRLSKLYILSLANTDSSLDIFITKYLNIYLIWNEGIAYGLLSFAQSSIYNVITAIIVIISIAVYVLIINSNDIRFYFYSMVFGGAIGNLFDRFYYSAVPDFIDLHINNYHWFIFNVADIFITIGVICLILVELIFNKSLKNEKR